MTQEEINKKNIDLMMQEMNRGVDATSIQRRAIKPGQISVLSYQPGPVKLHVGATLAAGSYATLVFNFTNNGLTATAGQTFLPVWYIDLFVDPSDTSSTKAMYDSGYIYPDGSNVTAAMANLTFTWYLRNSTPSTSQSVVSYVIGIRNQDASPHAYWISAQLLLPADGNLNPGSVARYLP